MIPPPVNGTYSYVLTGKRRATVDLRGQLGCRSTLTHHSQHRLLATLLRPQPPTLHPVQLLPVWPPRQIPL